MDDPNKFFAEQRFTRSCMKNWEIIADNLSKAGWSWAVCQLSILMGEQCGLLTLMVTESGSLCAPMKS